MSELHEWEVKGVRFRAVHRLIFDDMGHVIEGDPYWQVCGKFDGWTRAVVCVGLKKDFERVKRLATERILEAFEAGGVIFGRDTVE